MLDMLMIGLFYLLHLIHEAQDVRSKISKKLQKLGLTLNLEKTQITSLRKSKCGFLEVDFHICENTDEHFKPIRLVKKNTTIRQRISLRLILLAPILKFLIKLENKVCKTK